MELGWVSSRTLEMAAIKAANRSGVYLIGKVYKIGQVPVLYDWVYVGRSDRLGRRLREHQLIREENPGLKEWLRKNQGGIEVWFAATASTESIGLEKRLIKELLPEFNRIEYKQGVNHEYIVSFA
ncbi:hypothetical protein SCD_n01075 [Sulfuricella denitrificans skB26]|uniref:GIY-YIG domain-containing protein n=1 Tax=Sulfuricella denitrificans (strain DSM 22764 / NBRC 105220 / skB26) TaxID=1163617 RepID=S6AG21_SULDS|nr:GIY-YIG nuclease family protein [Sulfuricella denitrificans]BAN34911.1 hypothetical protein SCD_n01075 [Sulfuricella denitrificans skB26]